MAKPNYSYEKRRREIEKKKKNDEKRRQKSERAAQGPEGEEDFGPPVNLQIDMNEDQPQA